MKQTMTEPLNSDAVSDRRWVAALGSGSLPMAIDRPGREAPPVPPSRNDLYRRAWVEAKADARDAARAAGEATIGAGKAAARALLAGCLLAVAGAAAAHDLIRGERHAMARLRSEGVECWLLAKGV